MIGNTCAMLLACTAAGAVVCTAEPGMWGYPYVELGFVIVAQITCVLYGGSLALFVLDRKERQTFPEQRNRYETRAWLFEQLIKTDDPREQAELLEQLRAVTVPGSIE